MKKPDEHIENLILRSLDDSLAPAERQELDAWLEEDPEHGRYLAGIEKIYRSGSQAGLPELEVDVEAEWQRFRQRVTPRQMKSQGWVIWRAAAALLLVAAAGYLLLSRKAPQIVTLTAGSTPLEVYLDDSSRITLNKGAVLTYPEHFAGTLRQVELSGEAFFEIKHLPDKPFRVNLSQSTVEVLGTSFNIYAPADRPVTEVTVISGRVKFEVRPSGRTIILQKGEKGTLMKTNNQLTKGPGDEVNVLAWKTGKIIFREVNLDEVIQTLNRLYDADIRFTTEVGEQCKVTVSFENQSLEAILSVLQATLDLEYRQQGDTIEIIRAGC